MIVVIPAAGKGSRFADAGYTFPKPLISINNKPMISRVVENFHCFNKQISKYVFLVLKEHLEQYSMESLLQGVTNNKAVIIPVDKVTEGAACTVMLAEKYIDNEEDVLVANSDQLVDFNPVDFRIIKNYAKPDGMIFCFNSTHPKWSFVKLNENDKIIQVAEKDPISDIATCGVYWWRHGWTFLASARSMISANIRHKGEFYLAPTYNELVNHYTILPFFVNKMTPLGTPEDMSAYLATL